jgi:hypothetical protein
MIGGVILARDGLNGMRGEPMNKEGINSGFSDHLVCCVCAANHETEFFTYYCGSLICWTCFLYFKNHYEDFDEFLDFVVEYAEYLEHGKIEQGESQK